MMIQLCRAEHEALFGHCARSDATSLGTKQPIQGPILSHGTVLDRGLADECISKQ